MKESEQFEPTDFNPTDYYSYDAVLHNAEEIPNIVPLYAGVGKLGSSATTIAKADKPSIKAYAANGQIRVDGGKDCLVRIYRVNGVAAEAATIATDSFTSTRLPKGIYTIQVASPHGETFLTTKIKL